MSTLLVATANSLLSLKTVVILGLNVWNVIENSQKFLPVPASGPFLEPPPSCNMFAEGGSKNFVHRDVACFCYSKSLFVKLFRNLNTHAHTRFFKLAPICAAVFAWGSSTRILVCSGPLILKSTQQDRDASLAQP